MSNPFTPAGEAEELLLKRRRSDEVETGEWKGGWYHSCLLLTASCTVMMPLSALIASVDRIVRYYSSSTFEMAFGVAFFTALPTAIGQLRNDDLFDSRMGSQAAFSARATAACTTLGVASFVLGQMRGIEAAFRATHGCFNCTST